MTQQCGFLSKLQHGDVVLADRRFTIEEDVAVYGAKLKMPAFTRGEKQLSQNEVEKSKQLSAVRIHVERVQCNRLVKEQIQYHQRSHTQGDTKFANIDKLLVVCSALTNLGKCVVS